MKKLFGILSVLVCATPMIYAQAGGIATLQSSDVDIPLNGAVKGKVIAFGSCGNNVNYELYDDYTLRIYGNGAMGDYTFQPVHAPWGVELYKKIKAVVIEDGVTHIGGDSFCECSALTKVSIPNSVKSIGYDAFRGCYDLTKVTIPNSVNHIAEGAFMYCSSLAEVNIPNSVTSIEKFAFHGCGFTELTIPSSVKSIGKYAFAACSLTKVNISNGVTSIGDHAFLDTDLEYVKIGKDVTEIGDQAFPQYHDEDLVIEFTSETPATLYNVESLGFLCTIYVPETALETYLNATFWKDHADQILPKEQTTGISSIEREQSEKKTTIYDLQGHKVTDVQPHGIYIVNGKKVMK